MNIATRAAEAPWMNRPGAPGSFGPIGHAAALLGAGGVIGGLAGWFVGQRSG